MDRTAFQVSLNPPSLADNTADMDRLRRGLSLAGGPAELYIDPGRINALSALLRRAEWAVTVWVEGNDQGPFLAGLAPAGASEAEVLAARPDMLPLPGPEAAYVNEGGLGLAVDLGTTGLVLELVDLADGNVLGHTRLTNPQVAEGPDILSRIHRARGQGLARLQSLVVQGLNAGTTELCAAAGRQTNDIKAVVAAGNTTMTHLLLGLDPFTICREPYIPLTNRPGPCPAGALGLKTDLLAPIWCLPNIGSYFGGDLIAGLISSGLAGSEAISILVDVGTNAEVVVGNRDWLMACAGAAGPALEGGVAKMGMAAAEGAIERVRVDPAGLETEISVIGSGPAVGLCGSGLIDLVAGLYLAGVIDIQAKILPFDHPRIRLTEDGPAFVVAKKGQAGAAEDILFSQLDLDVLLRSKAAMYTILTTLLNQVGLNFRDLERFYVAGAFGQHIDPAQAITIGMLPDLPLETYIGLGNSSLAGAKACLLSPQARQEALDIRERITYLELNVNQEFMNRFSAAKFMPHTEAGLFPSVPSPYRRTEPLKSLTVWKPWHNL